MSDTEHLLETALRASDLLVAELRSQLQVALARIAFLEEKLRQSSLNSSKPPSQDPPNVVHKKKTRSGKKRGGQKGHPGHHRELLPPEKVTATVPLFPTACRRCQGPLSGQDPTPFRHQVVELPKIVPLVTEYQLHHLMCPTCQISTCASLPPGVPTTNVGPRLCAFLGLASGNYHLSKRASQDFCEEVLGVEISLGAIPNAEQTVSGALKAPVEEAKKHAQKQKVVHADETSWREGGEKAWLWVLWTSLVTVFQITLERGTKSAQDLLGTDFLGILVTDRWVAYQWVNVLRRQFCWAHLLREFEAMSERPGLAGICGKGLLAQTRQMFKWWHLVKEGTMSRAEFREEMEKVKTEVGRLLRQGKVCNGKTGGVCRKLLEFESALWTFVEIEGVEPTNNAAERVLRAAVLWRKGSYGTQSERGSRFVERILTAVTTLKQQGRNVLEYLTAACEAVLKKTAAPSLLPQACATLIVDTT